MKFFNKKHNYGLVLSGGAARGLAHPGAIKALHEAGIEPGIISGASAGAIAGAFYADGFEPEEILDLFKGKKVLDFTQLKINKTGLLDIKGLKKLLKENLKAKKFKDMKKPFVVSVTNFSTGKPEYISDGDLVEAVLASSSIPMVFHPVKMGEHYYIDGGVLDNFPILPIEDKCKKIIGVAVNPIGEQTGKPTLISLSIRSLHLAVSSEMAWKKKKVDIFIEPAGLRKYSLMDAGKAREMFDLGYQEAKKVLESAGKSLKNAKD